MPIVNVKGVGKIEFPDSMTGDEIDAAIKNEILPAFARPAPDAPSPAAASTLAANPFSKGTGRADPNYRVGDHYRYRVVDLLTKLESGQRHGGTVKAVTESEITYGNGRVTDLLGNTVANNRGQTFTGSQIFVAEYSVGRKWSTSYRGTRRDLNPEEWNYDLKVVDRESITVPAGTFDAFKVEGQGYSKSTGDSHRITYWIAPEKVRVFIVYEVMRRKQRGRYTVTDRSELVDYRQRR